MCSIYNPFRLSFIASCSFLSFFFLFCVVYISLFIRTSHFSTLAFRRQNINWMKQNSFYRCSHVIKSNTHSRTLSRKIAYMYRIFSFTFFCSSIIIIITNLVRRWWRWRENKNTKQNWKWNEIRFVQRMYRKLIFFGKFCVSTTVDGYFELKHTTVRTFTLPTRDSKWYLVLDCLSAAM